MYGVIINGVVDETFDKDKLADAIEYVNDSYTLLGDTHAYVAEVELIGEEYIILDKVYPKR